MVDGVKTGVCPIKRSEEREYVHTFIHAIEPGAQNICQRSESAFAKPVGISNKLYLVFHQTSLPEGTSASEVLALAQAHLIATYRYTVLTVHAGQASCFRSA